MSLRPLRTLLGSPRARRLLSGVGLIFLLTLVISWISFPHLRGVYHRREARKALTLSRIGEAREHVEICAQIWPRDFATRLLAAQLARRLDNFEEAEKHLTACQTLRGAISDEIVLEQSLIRAQRGGMDEMFPYLRSLVEKEHPETPRILEAMARGYIRVYRYTDAAAVLARWIHLVPDDVQALLLQGWIREQEGPQDLAIGNYKRVLELDPDNEEALLRLAFVLLDRALPNEALPYALERVRRRPQDLESLVQLARCYTNLGREDEAREVLDRVLVQEPSHRSALCAQGELALQIGEPAVAEKLLRRALELDPADYNTHFSWCRSLRQMGRDEDAIKAEVKLRVMDNDIRRIRKVITEDLSRRPNDPAVLTEIGVILVRAGSTREGVEWLYRALRHDPDHAPAHSALLAHYERTGDTRLAERHRKVLQAQGQF